MSRLKQIGKKHRSLNTEAEMRRASGEKMLVSQLINLTISKEEELAKQKAIKE